MKKNNNKLWFSSNLPLVGDKIVTTIFGAHLSFPQIPPALRDECLGAVHIPAPRGAKGLTNRWSNMDS